MPPVLPSPRKAGPSPNGQQKLTGIPPAQQPSPFLYSGQLCTILQASKNQGEIMRSLETKRTEESGCQGEQTPGVQCTKSRRSHSCHNLWHPQSPKDRTPSGGSSWPLGTPGNIDFSTAFFLQAFLLLAPLYPSKSTHNPTCSARGSGPHPGGRVGLTVPCLILVRPPQREPVSLKDGGKHLLSHAHPTELSCFYMDEGQASFL